MGWDIDGILLLYLYLFAILRIEPKGLLLSCIPSPRIPIFVTIHNVTPRFTGFHMDILFSLHHIFCPPLLSEISFIC